MKLKCNIISGIMILLLTFTANPAKALKTAEFAVSDPFITVGEGFDVTVSVMDDGTLGDLTGFGFDVDPLGSLSLISFQGYTIDTDYFDLGTGSHVEGAYLGFGNSNTNVLLATLSFTAGPIAGNDLLMIDGPFDENFFSTGLFYLNLETDLESNESLYGSINIIVNQAVTPIPEPATILLLTTGMFGLGVFGRKKFKK